MRGYQVGAHTRFDLKAHLIRVPKYRKRVLLGQVAIRVRDVLGQIAMEHEIDVISGKVAVDYVHMFVSFRPTQDIAKVVQYFKGISSRIMLQEFAHLKKQFWGRHFWARGYCAITSGTITDEIIQTYIEEQEKELVEGNRFTIDS